MALEYKTVGAPERGRRKRGARSRSDRAAAAMQEILHREAVDGWRYLRTDLIPVEERVGWFGRTREVSRAVMVFCRGGDDMSPRVIERPARVEASSHPGDHPQTVAAPVMAPAMAAPEERAGPHPPAAPAPRRQESAVLEEQARAPATEMAEKPTVPMTDLDDGAQPAMKINRMMERQKSTLRAAKAANES